MCSDRVRGIVLPNRSKMINFRFKKASTGSFRHDPSFYDRFNIAWTNLHENEVELRVRLLTAESKPRNAFRSRTSDVRV